LVNTNDAAFKLTLKLVYEGSRVIVPINNGKRTSSRNTSSNSTVGMKIIYGPITAAEGTKESGSSKYFIAKESEHRVYGKHW